HEIGHAFHSYILRNERPFANRYPMTLAESASTFAELILTEGLQKNDKVAPRVKELLVDEELNHFTSFLLDIPVRFHFEKAFYERRAKGELGITDLNELMVSTQRRIFGDTLVKGGENPWYWASKMHFFITGVRFYNFPYTFGYLLSRALHRLKRQQGEDFLPRYQNYLEKSGTMSCEDLIRDTLGEDITGPEFWDRSIQSITDLGVDFGATAK
ncbi:MAG: M3 family metallopeptidase, partial [Verrucomicrobiales bacterium]